MPYDLFSGELRPIICRSERSPASARQRRRAYTRVHAGEAYRLDGKRRGRETRTTDRNGVWDGPAAAWRPGSHELMSSVSLTPPPLCFGWNGRLGGWGVSGASISTGSFNIYSLEQYPRQSPTLYFIYLLVYFIFREAISLWDSSVLRPDRTNSPTPTPPHHVSTRNEGVGGGGRQRPVNWMQYGKLDAMCYHEAGYRYLS